MGNLTFIFSGSHKKFSFVLFQITNYIYSPSLRGHPVYSALGSSFSEGDREATTGDTSSVRRLL